VGGVSVSYDLSQGVDARGGDWNMTAYGRRFFRMSRSAGAGPMQIM
jgi:hypothetical protein